MHMEVIFGALDRRMDVALRTDEQRFDAPFAAIQTAAERELEPYTGAYTVTPRVTAQVLPTAQKRMTQDMTIREIPYYQTSNPQQGETVYIGTEAEIYGG